MRREDAPTSLDPRVPYKGSNSKKDFKSRTLHTRASVCKIHYHGKKFDFAQPYNKHQPARPSTGTGFILEEFPADAYNVYVVTAYHVVDNASRIMCEFSEIEVGPIASDIVAYSVQLDVAIVAVPTRGLGDHKALKALKVGDSDGVLPTYSVLAAGFALGHDYQMTSGTVSGRTTDRIQVDCAVNGGNSGGPLLDLKGRVLGVVVSGYTNAQNVNFVSPIAETLHVLRPMFEKRELGVLCAPELSFNATLVPAGSALVSQYGCPTAAFVTQIHPSSSLAKDAGMQRSDALCEIGGYQVDLRGKVDVGWWTVDSLEIDTILQRASEGDEMKVTYWSHARNELVRDRTFRVQRTLNTYRYIDPYADPPRYSCRGGLVVQPLLRNHRDLSKAYHYLLQRPQLRETSMLVISFARPESPFTTMDTVSDGDIITHVDDRPVKTLDEYVLAWREWDESEKPYIKIMLYDGNIAACTREELEDSETTTKEETELDDLDVLKAKGTVQFLPPKVPRKNP